MRDFANVFIFIGRTRYTYYYLLKISYYSYFSYFSSGYTCTSFFYCGLEVYYIFVWFFLSEYRI